MQITLIETKTGNSVDAKITSVKRKEFPLRKDGWQFTWRKLAKVEGAHYYKITTTQTPERMEGILMLTLLNEEMLFMNNIEVAPHNYGRNGQFEKVAGCLLAFGCKKSFELGRGSYTGFLAFESKTKLINVYREKYGATLAIGQKMFFEPEVGQELMNKYLGI